jgi:hypothetical protein
VSRLALVLAALALGACGGPLGWIPGGKLDGQTVSAPVDDWTFAREIEKAQLETDPSDPYSVTVWFVSEGPSLWVFAGGGESSTWAKHLLADPHAILRLGEKLYPRKAVRVTDPEEIVRVLRLYREKYDYTRDPNGAFGPIEFRLDPP